MASTSSVLMTLLRLGFAIVALSATLRVNCGKFDLENGWYINNYDSLTAVVGKLIIRYLFPVKSARDPIPDMWLHKLNGLHLQDAMEMSVRLAKKDFDMDLQ